MKKALFFILFIPCVSNMFSQNLIYQFHGIEGDPAKENYIKSLSLGEVDDNLMTEVSNYYETNKAEICWNADIAEFEQLLLKLAEQAKVDQEKSAAMMSALTNAVAQGIAESQQRKAEEQQQKAAQEAQWRAERQAALAKNKQKYAEFQAMTNRSVNTSNYQSTTSRNASQGSYNDLLTSDPNRNMAVQQSVQQYGISATRDAINQANAYDAQSRSTGGYGGQVISAVTSNRQAIKIQVRDRKIGGRIVAYSLGGNAIGQQQWRPTDGIISKCTSNMEYQYTAYLQGVGNIYFDL